jgi:hypothetical protein
MHGKTSARLQQDAYEEYGCQGAFTDPSSAVLPLSLTARLPPTPSPPATLPPAEATLPPPERFSSHERPRRPRRRLQGRPATRWMERCRDTPPRKNLLSFSQNFHLGTGEFAMTLGVCSLYISGLMTGHQGALTMQPTHLHTGLFTMTLGACSLYIFGLTTGHRASL